MAEALLLALLGGLLGGGIFPVIRAVRTPIAAGLRGILAMVVFRPQLQPATLVANRT